MKVNYNFHIDMGSSSFVLAALLLSTPAHAQTASDRPASVDATSAADIIVTAQRRQERLQDVPISVAVLGGAKLEAATAGGSTNDILNTVAGVSVTQQAWNGSSMVTIRGVSGGTALIQGSSTVGFYVDGLPFGFVKSALAPNLDPYDLDRIEVLRGPQGTLYGANSQNGVVRVLTHDADPSKFELKVRSMGMIGERGAASYGGDAAVNVPIISDVLAARFVVSYHSLGGWIDRANQPNANHAETQDYRARIRYDATDRLKIGLTAWQSYLSYANPSIGSQPYFDSSLVSEPGSIKLQQYGGTIDYDFGPITLSTASGILRYNNHALTDYNSPIPGKGFPGTIGDTTFRSEVQSHELNIRSANDKNWRWNVGGLYREAQDHLYIAYSSTVPAIVPFLPVPSDTLDESKSFSFYGEVTRLLFNSHLELTAGARYFHDEVTSGDVLPFNGIPGTPLLSAKIVSHKLSPRFVITYHPDRHWTLYASYSEGFRSGVPQNPTVTRTTALTGATPDNLTNYEIGAKGSLFDGRLTFDSAVYYMKWKNVQETLSVPFSATFVTAIVNGTSASGAGVDLSVGFQPVAGLKISGAFDWNGLRADSPTLIGGVALYNTGDRLALSPEFTGNVSIEYSFPLSSELEGRFSISGQESSGLTSRTVSPPKGAAPAVFFGADTDSLFLGKASFSIERGEKWSASIFVDNITNVNKVVVPSYVSKTGYPDWATRTRPRSFGLQLQYRY